MAKHVKNAIKAVAVFIVIGTIASVFAAPFMGGFSAAFSTILSPTALSLAFAGTLVGSLMTKSIEATQANFGSKFAVRAATAPRQIVYGECRVGGTIAHMETAGTDNHMLHMIVVLAGHEIQSVESVRLNDVDLTSSTSTINSKEVHTATNSEFTNTENPNAFTSGRLIRFSINLGTDDQAADNFAVQSLSGTTQGITSTDRYRGCAYVYLQMVYDAEKFSGMPAISFKVKGKKVFDPRDSSTAFSSNPALIIRDFLTDTTYGLKCLSSEINDTTNAGGFGAAANICDQDVTLADNSTTEKRYTANGFTNFSATGTGIIEGLLTSMAGQLTYTNGKFNVFAGAAQTPSLTITDDNLLEPIVLTTRSQTGELYNTVKPIFVDASNNFIGADAPVYEDSTFLTEDTPNGTTSDKPNFKKQMELRLPFTTTHTMAQRIGRIALIKQRDTQTISCLVDLKFMQLQPVDWVYVTNERLGFNQKVFEVVDWELAIAGETDAQFLACRLSLKEASSSTFTFNTSDYQTAVASGSNLSGGTISLAAPTNLSIATDSTSVSVITNTSVTASWTNASSPYIIGTEVQFKRSSDSVYSTSFANAGATKQQITGLEVGVTYNFRVRHISARTGSAFITANHTVGGTAIAVTTLQNANTTADDVGLGNVDNESSATIRGQETSGNHTGTVGGVSNSTITTGSSRANSNIDGNGRFTGDLTGDIRSNGTTRTPAQVIDGSDRATAGLDSSGNVNRAVPAAQINNALTTVLTARPSTTAQWVTQDGAVYSPTGTNIDITITADNGTTSETGVFRWSFVNVSNSNADYISGCTEQTDSTNSFSVNVTTDLSGNNQKFAQATVTHDSGETIVISALLSQIHVSGGGK
jgi:hypothetical protein